MVKGIRGVNSDGVISSLVDKGLIREMGRDPDVYKRQGPRGSMATSAC